MKLVKFRTFWFLWGVLLLTQCQKDTLNDYYARPSWLAQPMYQQLTARGNFKSYLSLVDRTNYKNLLSSTGYFSCFAPNDAAFETFLKENSYSSVSDIDSTTASAIVRYSLIFNSFDSTRINDYQSTAGWVENESFKRRTTYYKWVFTETYQNTTIKVYNGNRNGITANYEDNNNKHIPIFTTAYFNFNRLTADDYTYFYPNSKFTGLNVAGASVVNANISAENGYIYEIDKVLLPSPSIYEYLADKSEYSEFKKQLDNYRVYWIGSGLQDRMKLVTGSSDPVYYKSFSASLAFSPNNENYLKESDNDAQRDGWSIFVPTNAVLLAYEKNVLAQYYNNDPAQIPSDVMLEFLNAHMWQTTVWPSKFASTSNSLGEAARFDKNTNVLEAKVLSNGMFYGTNKVQQSNTFSSVYAQPFLNPNYSLTKKALGSEFKSILNNLNSKFTLFVVTDEAIMKNGFSWSNNYGEWQWYGSSSLVNQWATTAQAKLLRDFNLQIVYTPHNELDDLSGSGIIKTYNEEAIKYSNYKVYGAGNIDSSSYAKVLGYRDYANGRVYFIDRLLQYSVKSPAGHLRELAGFNPTTNQWEKNTDYYLYYKYLISSGLITVTDGDSSRMAITNVGSDENWSFFVPRTDAVLKAISDGVLPAYTNTDAASQLYMKRFLLYHIVKRIIIPNGDENDNASIATAYKNLDGVVINAIIANQNNSLKISNTAGNSATIINSSSNNLSSMAVIHLVDNYVPVIGD